MEIFKKDILQTDGLENSEEQLLGKRLMNVSEDKKKKL